MDISEATKYIHEVLRLMVTRKGSDLFLTSDFPPAMKLDGKLTPLANQTLTAQQVAIMARSLMNDKQAAEFESTKECNFAVYPKDIGRFRISVFVQQGRVGLVIRTINITIPRFDDLGLPESVRELVMHKNGLVLVVGGTGSGKSTTLASMIDHRNEHSYGHIITIEDPVEYIHSHKNCIITHREVGTDTDGWEIALKNTLRQAPDVILIGEIRDQETMEHAIAFAETGHLCLATLHANSANQAIDRIINFFPEERRQQLLMDLSLNLRGIVSQRLVPKKPQAGLKGGRLAAVEVLLNSPLVSDIIFKGVMHELKEVMKQSRHHGMQTFDQALFDAYDAGLIEYEDALRFADSVNDLRLNIKLQSKDAKQNDLLANVGHLNLI